MERIDTLNPDRIQWCLDDFGVTPEELGDRAGVSAATMKAVLAGEKGLTFAQLQRVAAFFGRDLLFFARRGPVREQSLRSPQFRTLTNQRPDLDPGARKLIERVGWFREVFLALREGLDEEDEPRFDPPAVDRRDPAAAAEAARAWLGLDGLRDWKAHRAAVEAKGVMVLLGTGRRGSVWMDEAWGVVGFSVFHETLPVIVVRRHDADARQSFTLMHELGHLLLHRSSFLDGEQDLFRTRGREREANAFGGHLLVPDAVLAGIDDARRPAEPADFAGWLRPATLGTGASTEVVLRRLLDAGRLPADAYAAYRAYVAALPKPDSGNPPRMYREREPLNLFGEGYVRTVLTALSAKQITLNKACGFLDNLKLKSLHELEAHVAGT